MYIKLKDRTYWVEDYGEGVPLLMFHGFTGSGRTFTKIHQLVTSSIRTVCIDLPGHGKTGPVGEVTMEQFASDLTEILDELELPCIHVLGYSLGGRAALSLAMTYPQYVSKLILESASPGIAHPDEQMARRVKDQGLIDKIASQGIEEFVNYWSDIPLFKSQEQLPIEVRRRVQEERLSHDPQGLIQSLKGMGTGRQPSWWDRLSHLSIDTLLIVGEWDEKFVAINREMHDQLPCSSLVIAEKAGHTVHLERPKFFAKIVEDFVIQ